MIAMTIYAAIIFLSGAAFGMWLTSGADDHSCPPCMTCQMLRQAGKKLTVPYTPRTIRLREDW